MAVTVTARKYNPGFLTDDELVGSFCVRTTEFEMLVEVLRECTGPSNPHQIVIGPRGSGKTSLLLRVAAEVRRDPGLAAALFPVVFAEESYEVSTAGEFWLECLSHLSVQAPRREDGPDLQRTFAELRTVRDDRTLAERCLGALLDFSDREGKRLVLLVENLNMLFRDMADPDAGWRLRKVLQTEPRIVLLASATSRFDEIDDPGHALYDLFSVQTLRPLDTGECATLWETVAGRCPQPGTIRSIEILTGGSPRLVAIVARFGAELSFRKLMASLLDLIDDHTEYFKSHLELLPAQERRVYLALAALWKPATTREIADQSRMETSKCSAQLTRLTGRGVVQSAGGSARRKQYYLTERLYNIYYLMRRSRRSDRLVEALIHFMESYYSPSELKDIGVRIIREADSFGEEMRSLSRAVLARLMELPAMTGYREELTAMLPEGFAAFPGRDSVPSDTSQTAETGTRSDGDGTDESHESADEVIELEAAGALFSKVVAMADENRAEDMLVACDEVVREFGESETPAVLALVAMVLVGKGTKLGRLNRMEEALAACDEVVRRFASSTTATVIEQVAMALVAKGSMLGLMNQPEHALATYDELVLRFGEHEILGVRGLIARALLAKGTIFRGINRPEDALAAYDKVVRQFGESDAQTLLRHVATALFNKGAILYSLKRPKEALDVFDEVIHRYGHSDDLDILCLTAAAFNSKGTILGEQNQTEEVLIACDEVIRRFGKSDALPLVEQVTIALVNKGTILDSRNRPEEALVAFDEAVRLFEENDGHTLCELAAGVLVNKGAILGSLNRPEEAVVVFDEVVRLFEENDEHMLCKIAAAALVNKGIALKALNRTEEALTTYDEVEHRFGQSDDPGILEVIAKALVNRGDIFGELDRYEGSLASYDDVVRRFGESSTLAILEQVAMALGRKVVIYFRLNQMEDVLETYGDIVERFRLSKIPELRALAEDTLLTKGEIELSCGRYEAAIKTTDQALDQIQPEFHEKRLRGHLVRARAALADGDQTACERDIDAVLTVLPEMASLSRESLDALMLVCVGLGSERTRELIKASPSASLLLPLATALGRELGLESRVAREVEEVAEDIRRNLAKLREARSDGTTHFS